MPFHLMFLILVINNMLKYNLNGPVPHAHGRKVTARHKFPITFTGDVIGLVLALGQLRHHQDANNGSFYFPTLWLYSPTLYNVCNKIVRIFFVGRHFVQVNLNQSRPWPAVYSKRVILTVVIESQRKQIKLQAMKFVCTGCVERHLLFF